MKRYLLLLQLALLGGCNCGKNDKMETKEDENVSISELSQTEETGEVSAETQKLISFAGTDRVHFAFDNSSVSENNKEDLEKVAAFLKDHPNYKIEIQGNCDIRGSEIYNMGLGDRRANSAREFLKSKGVEDERMVTVSFGARILFPGDSEEIYAKNRAALIVVKAQ